MLHIGLDVGSTTVKIAVLDDENNFIYKKYQRHYSDIKKTLAEVLEGGLDEINAEEITIAVTGSGGISAAKWLGIPFIQEVSAGTTAIETLIPETDVAIELGGEDAKITYLRGGIEQRMNGTCAGGTGAFIDQMAALLNTDITGLNEMAKEYEDCGIRRLHIVDLDGAKAKRPCNLAVLEKIAGATSLDIEWGGGIKDSSALRSALDAGAGRIICGSIAVDDRWEFTSWLSAFGPSRIILGADVREGKVATHGWLKDSGLSLEELMGWYVPEGLSQMICTDISKDGMLQGPDFEFYTALMQSWPSVDVTLSGGISCMEDIVKADE